MKKYIQILVSFVLVLIMSVGISSFAFAEDMNGITVRGRGVVEVDPDTAIIYAYINTDGKTATEAQRKNNDTAGKVKTAMINAGISADKILTESTYVSPNYRYDETTGKSSIIGYRAYTYLSFTTSDVDNSGKYYDTALEAGASGAHISFTLDNSSAHYAQALKSAVKTAQDSANAIAEACGIKLGAIKSVNENSSNYYVTEAALMKNFEADDTMNSAGGATEINYDKISISASVSITYGIN